MGLLLEVVTRDVPHRNEVVCDEVWSVLKCDAEAALLTQVTWIRTEHAYLKQGRLSRPINQTFSTDQRHRDLVEVS